MRSPLYVSVHPCPPHCFDNSPTFLHAVVITGCEVSLWAGEQFASDMRLVFPKLKIEVLSANKILGSLGQRFAVPQPGFPHHRSALFLSKTTMVLIVSHSGSTFSSLASANLLKVVTPGAILQL